MEEVTLPLANHPLGQIRQFHRSIWGKLGGGKFYQITFARVLTQNVSGALHLKNAMQFYHNSNGLGSASLLTDSTGLLFSKTC